MRTIVEHYNAERVPNPNPRGAISWKMFTKVRGALVAVCRKYGVTGPDDLPKDSDFWVVESQYNDERYQYIEVYKRQLLSPEWLKDMMAALRRFPGWGAGLSNIRFAYVLIFGDKLMVTGFPLADCDGIASVAAAASANLWGVHGEESPYTAEEFNRDDLLAANVCGCYHCCAMFAPSEIVGWEDPDESGVGQTAICPRCEKSRVIAAKPSFTLAPTDLRQLSELAFGPLNSRSTS